jgi:hypothetical protein
MSVFQACEVVERPWPTTPMGSMFIKIAKLRLTKKGGEGGVTWNFGESPPTIVMVSVWYRSTYGSAKYGYDMGKNHSQLYNLRIPTRRVGTKSEPILGGINTRVSTGATWDSNTK